MENNFSIRLSKQKIDKDSLYTTIADRLEEIILDDISSVDTKLPSEQYIADSFGVSRPVVREALKILKERGLVSSRQGAATVISEPSAQDFMKSINRIAMLRNASPSHIHQIRISLDILSVRLAAENHTSEHIATLRRLNDEMAACVDVASFAKLDIDFHKCIATASGNPMLEIMIEALSTLLSPMIETSIDEMRNAYSGVSFHKRIIDAIESGDSEESVRIMRSHLTLSMRNYEISR